MNFQMIILYPDLTPSQFQYWASLNPSLISLLIQNHDHVTFYTWQSKSKSDFRLGKSNPSLILDLASLNPNLILDLTIEKNVKNSRKKRQK